MSIDFQTIYNFAKAGIYYTDSIPALFIFTFQLPKQINVYFCKHKLFNFRKLHLTRLR